MTFGAIVPPVAGLILDLDDTLIDTRGAMVHAGTVAAQRLWPEYRDWQAVGRRYFIDPGGFFDAYARGELPFATMRRLRLDETQAALGLPPVENRDTIFEAEYSVAYAAAQRQHDDAPTLLAAADRRGIPMVLLTNSPQSHADMKLAAVGLTDRFVRVITTDTLGFGKPDRRVFDLAIGELGIPASAVVSVGDHLGRDVLAARSVGAQAIWLHRDGDLKVCQDEIDDAVAQQVPTVADLAAAAELLGW